MTTPTISDNPLTVLERSVFESEQRRDQQLAYITVLEKRDAPTAYAQRVLREIDTTLRRSREHYTFIQDLSDGGDPMAGVAARSTLP